MKNSIIRIERFLTRLKHIWMDISKRSKQVYVWHRISEYRNIWSHAAVEIGADFKELANDLWEVHLDGRTTRILNDILEYDDPVTLAVAGRKPTVYRLLKSAGLQIPEYELFTLDELDKAYVFLKHHPKGCVVKPANGTSSGQGVTTHLLSAKEVRKAAILASLYCRELIIEPMVHGECFRLLILEGKMIHAVGRRGIMIEGDGFSSVADLIEIENKYRSSNNRPLLEIDRDYAFNLASQNLSMSSVITKNRKILIKSVEAADRRRIEVRTVYNCTVTEEVCDEIKLDAERAARLLRSNLVGVDFITPDISQPLQRTGGIINELNTTPGLHHHYDREYEQFPRPAIAILESLLRRTNPYPAFKP